MTCRHCSADVPQVEGKRAKLYCDATCKRLFFQKKGEKVTLSRKEYEQLLSLIAKPTVTMLTPEQSKPFKPKYENVISTIDPKAGDMQAMRKALHENLRQPKPGSIAYYSKFGDHGLEELLP